MGNCNFWATRYPDIAGVVGGDELVALVHLGRPPVAHPLQEAGEAGVDAAVASQRKAHPVAARFELAALAGPLWASSTALLNRFDRDGPNSTVKTRSTQPTLPSGAEPASGAAGIAIWWSHAITRDSLVALTFALLALTAVFSRPKLGLLASHPWAQAAWRVFGQQGRTIPCISRGRTCDGESSRARTRSRTPSRG